jgi:glycerophosphoryl diester phosphodiesterase
MGDRLSPLRRAPGVVRLHGHRAARGVWPENTMLAFRGTLDLGIRVVELDVLSTRDGVPVVTHNPRLMAASTRDAQGRWLTDEGPRIYDLTFEELQSYDVGGLRAGTDYANRYPDQAYLTGQRIPRLADVAALVCEAAYRDTWLNIEIKSSPEFPENTPPLRDYVTAILQVLRAHELLDRVILQSFDWRVLEVVQDKLPELPRSYLSYVPRPNPTMDVNAYAGSPWIGAAPFEDFGGSLPRLVAHLGGKVWCPFHEDLDPDEVALAHDLGLIVNTWTVNRPEDLRAAIAAGVDGIITDYPGRAQRVLLAEGLTWREDIPALDTAG